MNGEYVSCCCGMQLNAITTWSKEPILGVE